MNAVSAPRALPGFAFAALFATTLATGTDGLDRMCNTMILLNDTDDGALRRQLVGRILPRGKDADYSKKKFWRIQPC